MTDIEKQILLNQVSIISLILEILEPSPTLESRFKTMKLSQHCALLTQEMMREAIIEEFNGDSTDI
jgi:hypothetical protein